MRALVSFAETADPADDWTAPAMRVACAVLFGIYLAFAGLLLTNAKDGLDPAGTPLGYDFSAFHTAARLAASGHAAATYDDAAMIAAEHAAFPGDAARIPWNYPPSFLFLLLPLAILPYAWAWVAWTGVTVAAHAAIARAMWPRGIFWPLMLAPAAAINLLLGQNGLLSLILLGGGMALLPARPLFAGLVLGFLSYKPHLTFALPLALLVGREWRALLGAAASAIGLVGISIATLGVGPWLAFFRKAGDANAFVASSFSGWQAVPSALATIKNLGGSELVAVVAQIAVAAFALAALVWVWLRRNEPRWRGASLAVAALLATPYVRIYDFSLLALPIAALTSEMVGPSWRERMISATMWLLPLLLLAVPETLPLGPPILILAMVLILRHSARLDGLARPNP